MVIHDKIVLGILGTQIKSLGNFNEICDEVLKCKKIWIYIWWCIYVEYYDQPKVVKNYE